MMQVILVLLPSATARFYEQMLSAIVSQPSPISIYNRCRSSAEFFEIAYNFRIVNNSHCYSLSKKKKYQGMCEWKYQTERRSHHFSFDSNRLHIHLADPEKVLNVAIDNLIQFSTGDSHDK